jgi:hypothetical protein
MRSSTSTSNERTIASTQDVRTLFLAWQDPDERSWYTVGRLDQKNGTYVFRYTQGAEEAMGQGFNPIVSFPDLRRTYESDEIFPLFANQVLSRNRPEFDDFVEWLSIPKDEADPIAILARTGDQVTDTLEIFPYPTKLSEHTYVVHFFVRGLRHQSSCAIERVQQLEPGDPLRLMPDLQNEHDEDACMLRTAEREKQAKHLMGYLPRYLAREMAKLSREQVARSNVEVVRVNPSPAPIHFRILCRLKMHWETDLEPFSSRVYQPIIGSQSEE